MAIGQFSISPIPDISHGRTYAARRASFAIAIFFVVMHPVRNQQYHCLKRLYIPIHIGEVIR